MSYICSATLNHSLPLCVYPLFSDVTYCCVVLYLGEKLSKQQLQSNNIIKKLRAKEKDSETLTKSQREKLDTQRAENERLTKVLDNKCDVEKQQTGACVREYIWYFRE